MAISVHCQADITVPRQSLGCLGRHVRTAEIRDKGMPHGVEVGVEAFLALFLGQKDKKVV